MISNVLTEFETHLSSRFFQGNDLKKMSPQFSLKPSTGGEFTLSVIEFGLRVFIISYPHYSIS